MPLKPLRRAVSIALGALIVMAASAAPPVPGHAQSGAPAVAASGGCGKPVAARRAELASVDGKHSMRSYVVALPAAYSPTRAYPVVFVFHGAGGNAAQSESWGLQRAPGAAEGAIFVYPNGVPFERYGVGWDDRSDGYDLPFFDRMLSAVAATDCVDTEKVFVAGFSWGGDFAIALACNRGELIRAIAANSTTDEFKDKADYRTYADLPCPSRKHPPIRFEHAAQGDPQYPPPFFATTSKLLGYLNSCAAGSSPVKSGAAPSTCVAYAGCSAEYLECTFDAALGHRLPPGWAEDAWAFFSRQSR